MYWYLNKQTDEAAIFSSLVAISKNTTLPLERLKYHFSRLKRKEYNDKEHRVVKTPVISSKRMS